MSTYSTLIHPEFRHTYALINHTTGEVFASSCDDRSTALKRVYRRARSERRYYGSQGKSCDLLLVNCVTGAVLEF